MRDARRSTTVPMPDLDLPSADITVAGLGPGDVAAIPLGAWQAIHTAEHVILRTDRHPCVSALRRSVDLTTCDDLYEKHISFQDVYQAIARRVVEAARRGSTVYAVPGHPWIGEGTTHILLTAAEEMGLSVRILGGASFVEAALDALEIDGLEGCQIVDGMVLAQRHHPSVDVSQLALIGQIYARHVASDVKLVLLNAYPPQHPVTLIQSAGGAAQRTTTIELHEVDRGDDFDHLTTLFVPPLPRSSLLDLQELIAHLRAPEGCPWDREQTLETLRAYLLDETAEVLEAIDNEDDVHTAEELGDVLGIICMITQVATEEGRFQMADAIHASVEKLTRRHPHVFGEAEVANMDELYTQWDAIKARERKARGKPAKGPLDDVPAALPALEKARQMQSKAEKMGLIDREELAAENEALAALLPEESDEEQLGQLLWQLVALAKQRSLNAETALRSYAVRFREQNR